MYTFRLSVMALAAGLAMPSGANGAVYGGCKFNSETLSFAGSATEQADCLLRKVKPKGTGSTSQKIPQWLLTRITIAPDVSAQQLKTYLDKKGISPDDVGGAVASGDAESLRYFVIHDTSYPEETGSFPKNIDDASYKGNNLRIWTGIKDRVHLIITRDGRSRTFNDWKASRSKAGVKIESASRAPQSKKVFAHVENVQPRIKPANSFAWIAPEPGLSPKQQERLALAYIVASVRAGQWLIPAFHFNIDEGLPDGHDDPQNVDLASWVKVIGTIHSELISIR
ncbi:hypothetical protein [Pannonibacter sp. SL95]|uniref:hypothetical protein n=1 Tax=Pannonibacter sp. SL95 TaxID=2995153 RepID=UPI0022770158|nr:hypothetical protein [Pannonibacter sp. SL95]MCY1708139.1 hypothetical protein [Pannonibacter sp. SL95]